ncbi:MAG: hypothetical protein RLZ56_1130 [Bacteroidota bacterium]|jgi:hypothetical protein
MKKNFKKISLTFISSIILLFIANKAVSQTVYINSDSAYKAGAPSAGRLWGVFYADYYLKSKADSNARGNANQYTGIPQDRNAFQFRRIYLGYDYNIDNKFSVELLLASEDNFPAGNPPSSSTPTGDQLVNNKQSFFIKNANLRWKQIWKGTDLVIGEMATPAFALLSEKVWSYRSLEKTITDIRKTPSYDLGLALQGFFDPSTKNLGYNIMIGNGSGAKPESDNYKWFYGDVFAYAFEKKLVVDLYADYEKLNWTSTWQHARQMTKIFIGYNSAATVKSGMQPHKGTTVGAEFFVNNLKNDLFATQLIGNTIDTLNQKASGMSFFVHTDIIPSKLRFIARADWYTPTNKVNAGLYKKYIANTANYNDNTYSGITNLGDPTYKQKLVTVGIDYTPTKNIHIMPNIWYNSYASQLPKTSNPMPNNADLVWRLTLSLTFGK